MTTKKGLAQMLKGGVIMDVVTPEQARIAEDAGAVAVEELFRRQACHLTALPDAVELVRALHQGGWKQAVGSSGPAANVALALTVLGITDYSAAIVTGDDITRGKPDPEIFRKALHRLGADPAHSVVIEDAITGVQAAMAVGAFTLGSRTPTAGRIWRRPGRIWCWIPW